MTTQSHSLELNRITHRFGATIAANDISLTTEPGELISLLGPSGCGKTTLLRIVAGFLQQTSGDVLVDGQSISHLPASKRRVGIVFQNYALFPHMTVASNVGYGLVAQRKPSGEIGRVVDDMLALVQMGHLANRFPRELSGGQQQRVALARCLAIQPRILLLDEPFSALDKNLRLDMQIEIKQLVRQAGITTILVTHDQEEALSMSDRIAVLSNGNLEQFAPPGAIYDKPATLFVNQFVGTTNLVKAEVAGHDNDKTVLRLGDGVTIAAPRNDALTAGAGALVSVRPENLMSTEGSQPGALSATITAVMPIGPTNIFEAVLTDAQTIKFIQERNPEAAAAPTAGTQVFVRVKNEGAINVFPIPT